MPKVNEQEDGHGNLEDNILANLANISVTTEPVIIVGVQRKLNTGNFENIDIYCGLALPLGKVDYADREALRATVAEAAEVGFRLTSGETGERFNLLKEMQKQQQGGR